MVTTLTARVPRVGRIAASVVFDDDAFLATIHRRR